MLLQANAVPAKLVALSCVAQRLDPSKEHRLGQDSGVTWISRVGCRWTGRSERPNRDFQRSSKQLRGSLRDLWPEWLVAAVLGPGKSRGWLGEKEDYALELTKRNSGYADSATAQSINSPCNPEICVMLKECAIYLLNPID